MRILIFLTIILINYRYLLSQSFYFQNPSQIQPPINFENIYTMSLADDSLCNTFIIWVKKNVKAHKHLYHTEQIYVLEGEAEIILNGEKYFLKPGSYLMIPRNTVHEVNVVPGHILKVLSFQTPYFDGNDRIWVDIPEKK